MKWKIEYTLLALIAGFIGYLFLINKKKEQISSFLGDMSLPRGIRNNNPGNLRLTSIPWQGKVPNAENTDGAFEQFFQFHMGLRAMILDIRNDIIEDGMNTLTLLLNEYAPPSENNTSNYIQIVSQATGISPHQTIIPNQDTMRKLVKSMAKVENGIDAVTDQHFNQAWNLI